MLTLDTARKLLALYRQMQTAAEAGEWDALGALEHEASTLRIAAESHPRSGAASAADAAELADIVTAILELDRSIRVHVEPARESTRKLLSSSVKGRAVRDAYGG